MRHKMFGGIHPAARKESTRRKALARMEKEPEWVILPLDQGGGGTAEALVRPGDRVLVGQPVAQGEGDGVPIHASVSGRVAAVEDQPHPWGDHFPAIVLQNDGRNTLSSKLPGPLALDTVTRAELIERVRESGIVDMGGSGLPIWNRLEGAVGRADTLIIDAMECEPYLSADHRLMLDKGRALMQTVRVLTRTLGPERAVMVIAGDKLNAVEAMERRLAMQEKGRVELRTMAARYPLDSEKQVVQAVTGREVPPEGVPVDVGCLVLNVATVYAIGQSLLKGLPLVRRAVTVSGGAVSRPRNLWVPIGTPFNDLLKACDGLNRLELLPEGEWPGHSTILAGSGVSLARLSNFALEHGLAGLEFAHGIPGSVGGGVYMNAGAYGGERGRVISSVSSAAFPPEEEVRMWKDSGFSYRHSRFQERDEFILRASFSLKPGDPAGIKAKMDDLARRRREKQPLEYPSAGSTFKRPEPVNGQPVYAAALIDGCGLKGLAVGGAQVSEKHAGFIVNRGGACCDDIRKLMAQVRERVFRETGVSLEPEVRWLGKEGEGWNF